MLLSSSAIRHGSCAGDGLVVSSKGPGLFLQGLAVHGKDGRLLPGKCSMCTCPQ